MQANPYYENVVQDVLAFLQNVLMNAFLLALKENLIWDMGFGFGKSVQHNYQLLQNLNEFCLNGYPVLAGLSRKSMIGAVLDKPVDQRIIGSAAGALIAVQKGAKILVYMMLLQHQICSKFGRQQKMPDGFYNDKKLKEFYYGKYVNILEQMVYVEK